MNLDLPAGSELHADSDYTDYELENLYLECEQIRLMVARKKNSKRPDKPHLYAWKNRYEKGLKLLFLG